MEKRKNKTRLARAAMTLLAMLCFLGGARAQETLTVCDGTATNSCVPIYGLYVDTQGQNSEFIIPAETEGMSDLAGGTISKLTFYITNSPATWGSPTVQVYMGEVEGTTLSSLNGPTNFTTVWTGELSNQSATMEITLSTPYTYEGGNLLIGMYVQTASSTYKGTSFSGISAPSGSSRYKYGSGNGTAQPFIPKTTFTYEPAQQGGCPKPTGLAVNYNGGTTATVTWNGTASQYDIDVNGTVTNNVTSPYPLNNLALATTYEVKVRANCGDEYSDYTSPKSFTTDACLAEDMCSVTVELNDAYGDGGGQIQVVNATTNEVLATITNSGASTSQEVSACPGTQLNFVFASTDSWSYENGWVITDPAGDVISEHVGCASSGDCTAPSAGTIATYTMNCSGCSKPSNLQVSDITTNSATLSWNGNNDSYVLQYRPWFQVGEDTQATGEFVTYTYDLSEFSGMGSIAIRHYDVTDMFYLNVDDVLLTDANGNTLFSEDFESGTIPSTWTNYDVDGDGYVWDLASSSNMTVNGNYGVYSASWLSGVGALTPDNWLIISNVKMGGTFSFAAVGQDPNYPAENFAVYVSLESDITEVPVAGTTYNAENLEPGTPYAWQVKGVCGEETTNWVSALFKTKDDLLVFATDGNWNEVANWTDGEGNAATALPTTDNKVRIDADAIVPAGYIAEAGKATINGGSITIKDGGQLKHKAATLKVTMEKGITGYGTGTGNYKFISSPFTGATELGQNDSWSCVENITTGIYDVYGFYSADENEWINYKNSGNHAVYTSGNNNGLRYGDGYLYANEDDITLNFTGTTVLSVNNTITSEVSYDASEDPFNGWMLIGNPFTCNGYVTYSDDATFYKMNEAGDGFDVYENRVELFPGEGAFIKVSASGAITFSSEAPEGFTNTSTSAVGILPLLPSHGEDDNQDANLDEEIVKITFAKEGYATYYNGTKDLELTAGMKAYVVTDGSTSLTYAEVADGDKNEVVPAETAVLLEIEPSTAAQTLSVYLVESSAAAYAGKNLLYGSDVAATTTGGAKYYKLTYSNDNSTFGWYWGDANGGAFLSPAHKAWLALPASNARSFLGLPDWQDATGIAPVSIDFENGEWYTLQGLKIGKKPTSAGVYIHNGRKVVVK